MHRRDVSARNYVASAVDDQVLLHCRQLLARHRRRQQRVVRIHRDPRVDERLDGAAVGGKNRCIRGVGARGGRDSAGLGTRDARLSGRATCSDDQRGGQYEAALQTPPSGPPSVHGRRIFVRRPSRRLVGKLRKWRRRVSGGWVGGRRQHSLITSPNRQAALPSDTRTTTNVEANIHTGVV